MFCIAVIMLVGLNPIVTDPLVPVAKVLRAVLVV
jgi:hypothetical protein